MAFKSSECMPSEFSRDCHGEALVFNPTDGDYPLSFFSKKGRTLAHRINGLKNYINEHEELLKLEVTAHDILKSQLAAVTNAIRLSSNELERSQNRLTKLKKDSLSVKLDLQQSQKTLDNRHRAEVEIDKSIELLQNRYDSARKELETNEERVVCNLESLQEAKELFKDTEERENELKNKNFLLEAEKRKSYRAIFSVTKINMELARKSIELDNSGKIFESEKSNLLKRRKILWQKRNELNLYISQLNNKGIFQAKKEEEQKLMDLDLSSQFAQKKIEYASWKARFSSVLKEKKHHERRISHFQRQVILFNQKIEASSITSVSLGNDYKLQENQMLAAEILNSEYHDKLARCQVELRECNKRFEVIQIHFVDLEINGTIESLPDDSAGSEKSKSDSIFTLLRETSNLKEHLEKRLNSLVSQKSHLKNCIGDELGRLKINRNQLDQIQNNIKRLEGSNKQVLFLNSWKIQQEEFLMHIYPKLATCGSENNLYTRFPNKGDEDIIFQIKSVESINNDELPVSWASWIQNAQATILHEINSQIKYKRGLLLDYKLSITTMEHKKKRTWYGNAERMQDILNSLLVYCRNSQSELNKSYLAKRNLLHSIAQRKNQMFEKEESLKVFANEISFWTDLVEELRKEKTLCEERKMQLLGTVKKLNEALMKYRSEVETSNQSKSELIQRYQAQIREIDKKHALLVVEKRQEEADQKSIILRLHNLNRKLVIQQERFTHELFKVKKRYGEELSEPFLDSEIEFLTKEEVSDYDGKGLALHLLLQSIRTKPVDDTISEYNDLKTNILPMSINMELANMNSESIASKDIISKILNRGKMSMFSDKIRAKQLIRHAKQRLALEESKNALKKSISEKNNGNQMISTFTQKIFRNKNALSPLQTMKRSNSASSFSSSLENLSIFKKDTSCKTIFHNDSFLTTDQGLTPCPSNYSYRSSISMNSSFEIDFGKGVTTPARKASPEIICDTNISFMKYNSLCSISEDVDSSALNRQNRLSNSIASAGSENAKKVSPDIKKFFGKSKDFVPFPQFIDSPPQNRIIEQLETYQSTIYQKGIFLDRIIHLMSIIGQALEILSKYQRAQKRLHRNILRCSTNPM